MSVWTRWPLRPPVAPSIPPDLAELIQPAEPFMASNVPKSVVVCLDGEDEGNLPRKLSSLSSFNHLAYSRTNLIVNYFQRRMGRGSIYYPTLGVYVSNKNVL